MTLYTQFFSASLISLAVGSFLFIISVVEDIKINLHSIHKATKNPKKSELQVLNEMSHFIQLHTDAKQLIEQRNLLVQ